MIQVPYSPRPFQKAFHDGLWERRFGLLICARQHGKTEAATGELIDRVVRGPEGKNYGYAAPYEHTARRVFWPRLLRFLAPFGDVVKYNKTDKIATLPGERCIYAFGLDNDGCRGLTLDGVVVDEFDNVDQMIYREALIPTMTTAMKEDRHFMIFIGTLKRYGKLWELYLARREDPDWYCQISKASDVQMLNKAQLARARLEMGDSAFAREYECDPNAPTSNSVVGELVATASADGRIKEIPIVPGLDVHTAWDIGIRDFTAVWGFQLVGSFVHVTHYWEFSELGLNQVVKKITRENLDWGYAILPHDIKVRDVMTGVQRLTLFKKIFPGKAIALDKVGVADSLSATRINFSRCIFNKHKAAIGVNRLRNSAYKVEPKTGTITDQIVHDDNSHGLDAFRGMSVWLESKAPTLKGGNFDRIARRDPFYERPKVMKA